jgi:hypothetical protein
MVVLALGLIGYTAIVDAGPAGAAAPLEHEHFQEDSSEIDDEVCPGLSLLVEVHVQGSFLFVSHGPDGLAYGSEQVRGTQSFTNVENGKTFTISFSNFTKDLTVTDNGDGTLTILGLSAGVQKAIGPDGEVLFIDAGPVFFEVLIDNAGTPTDPFDDEFLEFLGIVRQEGRNDTADRDFCTDLQTFIG